MRGRWRATVEIVSMLAVIVLFIWWVRAAWPWAWAVPFAFMLASTVSEGDWRPRLDRFRESLRAAGLPVVALAAIVVAFARMRRTSVRYAIGGLVLYFAWGLVQQYVLNGFFVRRLEKVAPRPALIPPAAAGIFGILHWPNPFLVAVAFAGGWLASWFYLRYRSVLFLGLAHGLLGTVLFLAVPDDISHHLNVGPGYIAICRRLHGGTHLWLVGGAVRGEKRAAGKEESSGPDRSASA
jgi:hypothetical protein